MAFPSFSTLLSTLFIITCVYAAPLNKNSSNASGSNNSFNPFWFNPGFDIRKVIDVGRTISSHSWELGIFTEALLEIYNPEFSVFGDYPFPFPTNGAPDIEALKYASSKIVIGTGPDSLSIGNGAVGDPSSLGIAAVMLGKSEPKFATAAFNQLDYTLRSVPRMWNNAISTRVDIQEVWADMMNMFHPFEAYYAADTDNDYMLEDAYLQCWYYRQILQSNTTAPYKGVWEHIIGPQSEDPGLWSTGNGWASMGMTRVLATIMRAPIPQTVASWRADAIINLTQWIYEIVHGAMQAPVDNNNHLLRNYLDDTTPQHGYGEFSGTALISAVALRMAVLQPQTFTEEVVNWAESNVQLLAQNGTTNGVVPHVDSTGVVSPTVNPLSWLDTTPFMSGSPEGQSFVALLYAALRDYKAASNMTQQYNRTVIERLFD